MQLSLDLQADIGYPDISLTQRKVYIYAWGNNSVRKKYKGKTCRILARGRMNSILLLFENGKKLVSSRYSVRLVYHKRPQLKFLAT